MNAVKIDAMLEAMQQVEQDLRDYKWMNEKVIEYAERNSDGDIAAGISQYGIEASLPKPSGTSDPTAREVQRLIREYERVKRYNKKLSDIDKVVSEITDERERAVAEAIM